MPAQKCLPVELMTKARVSPELLACGEKGGVYVGPDGREMLGAAVSLGRDGWRLVSDMPVSEVLAGYRRQMRWVVFGALATVALVRFFGRKGR